jgi:putative beta-lysine N-acetyltransferase
MRPVAVNLIEEKKWADQWEDLKEPGFSCRILISPYNLRITVYEFLLSKEHHARAMIHTLEEKAVALGLDKIWLKSPVKLNRAFTNAGMIQEATVPGYFLGREPALIFSKYLSVNRQTPSQAKRVKPSELFSVSGNVRKKRDLPGGIQLKWCREEDCRKLAGLYRSVFPTYPFPLFDPAYLEYSMRHHVLYISAWFGEELVAAASAEIDIRMKNAEMTDFATAPRWRGHGLAGCLLEQLENRLRQEAIPCLYTISRSSSTGMNRVFAGAGYLFYGVLVNNCNIGGGFEDMYVWAKVSS